MKDAGCIVPSRADLARVLGNEVSTVRPLRVVSGGYHSKVFEVDCGKKRYVLRVPVGQQGFHTRFLREHIVPDQWFDLRWAIEQARSVCVPAPKIVYSSRDDNFAFGKFVVLEKLQGEQTTDYEGWDGCPYEESEFGALLRRIHSVRPGGFGPVDDFGKTYFDTWQAFLVKLADEFIQRCDERSSISPAIKELLVSRWRPLLCHISLTSPSLLHMESLGFGNILYDPVSRRITGLLDYEDCLGGDPLFEVIWMRFYFESNGQEQTYFDFAKFERGYGGTIHDDGRGRLYWPFTWLQKLSWIEVDSARARHHAQKVKEACEQL
jgi:aminoglycoside phosphotransferase (APT) family kinase protein